MLQFVLTPEYCKLFKVIVSLFVHKFRIWILEINIFVNRKLLHSNLQKGNVIPLILQRA